MKRYFALLVLPFCIFGHAKAQNENENEKNRGMSADLPYYKIPSNPEAYTSGSVAARVIDALGFRYYWATEGLRDEDLKFKPGDDARTTMETLDHIYGLSWLIVNAPDQKINQPRPGKQGLTFEEKRKKTLQNFKKASDILKASDDSDLKEYNIVYGGGEKKTEFPFWNLLNGPIADAIWHVGQVVSFRRSSGNPLNRKVSVFHGKLRE